MVRKNNYTLKSAFAQTAKKGFSFCLAGLFFISGLYAQTKSFTGPGGTINNNGKRSIYSLQISGIAGKIDYSWGIYGVTVNLKHSKSSDLNIFIVSPDGTVIELSSGNGGSKGQNYTSTTFSNKATQKITEAAAPFQGTFKPEGSLGVLNNGQNPNGSWSLVIDDLRPGTDTGYLNDWKIIFNSNPCKLEEFESSNLPLLLINTFGKAIPDDPRIYAEMKVMNSGGRNYIKDTGNYKNIGITIETRGSTSQSFPKKPYGFTTVTKALADTNLGLLGFPDEHDWILNATYNDKSLMRDVLSMKLANDAGMYASRTKYCELFINGEYQGLYILMEKVKRDKNRVNISKLTAKDTTGNSLTGGYIIKIDKTTGNNNGGWTDTFPINPGSPNRVYMQYDYPNGDDLTNKQKNYIQDAIYKFEKALASSSFMNTSTGYRAYADINSMINFSIINEISNNADGYRLSSYFYKDQNSKNSKFIMGPVWDFNLSFNNDAGYYSHDNTIWQYNSPDAVATAPFWWRRVVQDSNYMKSYYCRWNDLRKNQFSLVRIRKFIDSMYKTIEEASYRNFERWPILGKYVWPNPQPYSLSEREDLDSMYSYIEKRVHWMDSVLNIYCNPGATTCKIAVNLTADRTKVCKGESVNLLADGTGNKVNWYDGKTALTAKKYHLKLTPDSTAVYKVVMSSAKGCKDSATLKIVVNPLPQLGITGSLTYCSGDSTTLQAKQGYTEYTWTCPRNVVKSSTVKLSETKPFNIQLSLRDSNGCADSLIYKIKVNPLPELHITSTKDTVCNGDTAKLKASGAYTYQWDFSEVSTDLNKAELIIKPLNTTYTVTGYSFQNCHASLSHTVYVHTLSQFGFADTLKSVCAGRSVFLQLNKGNNLVWNSTDNSFQNINAHTIKVSPLQNTRYQVQGNNAEGCPDSVVFVVKVKESASLSIAGDTAFCKGTALNLVASGADSFKWEMNGKVISKNKELQLIPDKDLKLTLTGSRSGDCADTLNQKVLVYPLPVLKITSDKTWIYKGDSVNIKAEGADRYEWKSVAKLSSANSAQIKGYPTDSSWFYVKGYNAHCEAEDSVYVSVRAKKDTVIIITHTRNADAQKFGIYPNPAQDKLWVRNNQSSNNANLTICVMSLDGRLLYTRKMTEGVEEIKMPYAQGVYLLQIREGEHLLFNRKVVLKQ